MILDLPRDCLVQDQVGETAGVDIDTASLGAQSQQVLVAVLQIRRPQQTRGSSGEMRAGGELIREVYQYKQYHTNDSHLLDQLGRFPRSTGPY